jgi:hypothetical protein
MSRRKVFRRHIGCGSGLTSPIKAGSTPLHSGTERVDAPPPLNPFAKAMREAKPEKQQELS